MKEHDLVAHEFESRGWAVLKHRWPNFIMARKDKDLLAVEINIKHSRPTTLSSRAVVAALRKSGIDAQILYNGKVAERSPYLTRLPAREMKAIVKARLSGFADRQRARESER